MAFTYVPYQKKEYQQSDRVNQAQQALQQHQQNKPGEYQSQWQQQMNDLLAQYQNRQPFQYDINADAMYQQMVDRYVQQGKQAMMDTMGQTAALTGGYGNSYAQTAGQQTYQGYLQGANDMLPQFYQMAIDRYQDEGNQLMNQYNLMANQEDMAYSRYNDQLNRYFSELDRLQGVYDSERDYDYSRFQNDQAFDYGMYEDAQNMQYQLDRNATEDARYDQEWAYQQERDKLEDQRYDQELARAQVDYLISIGAEVSDSLLAASGYDKTFIEAINAARAATSNSASSGKQVDVNLVNEATSLAKQYGTGVAVQYIQDQIGSKTPGKLGDGKKPDAIKALDNAKGVSMTDYYKKMLAAQTKK